MPEETIQLSDREAEILRLVATGATNQQIADNLDISVNTVKVHMRNIFGKIGASSRTEATLYAMRQGLVEVAGPARSAPIPESLPEPETLPSLSTPPIELAPADPPPATIQAVSLPPVDMAPAPTPAPAPTNRLPGWALALGGLLSLALVALIAYIALGGQSPGASQPASAPVGEIAPQPERWKPHAPLSPARSGFALAGIEGRIYCIGGSDASGPLDSVQRFDPQNNIWVPLSNKPTAVTQIQAVTVGGRIYVPGGELADGSVSTGFEVYDPRSERWETLAPLPEARSRYALAGVEGRVYLFGGWDGQQHRAEVFIYDPIADQWEQGRDMPTSRSNAGAAVVDNRIYVVGGENDTGALRVNERYDPSAGLGQAWDGAVPLPEPIAAPAVVGIASFLLVFDPERQAASIFQPASESWVALALPADVAISSRAAALTTSVFVFGGADNSLLDKLYEYEALRTTFLPVPINP